jgi:hypothetical protein
MVESPIPAALSEHLLVDRQSREVVRRRSSRQQCLYSASIDDPCLLGIALGQAFLTEGSTPILVLFVAGVMLPRVFHLSEWTTFDPFRSGL